MSLRRRFPVLCTAFVSATSPALAQETLPVARVVIYPGEKIVDSMIAERTDPLAHETEGRYAHGRSDLIGKVTRRTLLPGQPILSAAIDNPRIVQAGAQTRIVFLESGVEIVAYGVAQQSGAIGEFIRIRNQESGICVSGRVQSDGSVRVGDS